MKNTKSLLGALAAAILFGGASAYSTTVEVGISNFTFTPNPVNISQGDSIRWVLVSGIHTTTSGTGCVSDLFWDSGTMVSGDTFVLHFDTTGNIPYFCSFHCNSYNMTGTVNVQGVGVEEESKFESQGLKFEILQNYPNPSRGSTNIRYSLAERSPVKIEVFDLVGRRVRTLVNSHQQAGQKQVEWNGEDDLGQPLNTGIYFIRYETPNFKSVRKLIHLR